MCPVLKNIEVAYRVCAQATTIPVSAVQAEAVVQVTMPDLTPVFQRLIMQGVKSEMLQVQTTYEPILEDLVRNLAEGNFDTTSQVQRFKMTRKDDRQWYVEESEREVPTEHQ